MTDSDTPSNNNQAASNPSLPQLPGAFSLLTPSWQAIKLNLITLIEFFIIPIILQLLASIFFAHRTIQVLNPYTSISPAWIVINILSAIISVLFAPGMTYTLLKGAKGEKVDFLPAFRAGLSFFWRYVGVLVCSGLLILIGFILLIVPGLFMLRRYYLAPYYLIDRNLSVMDTLRTCKQESVKFSNAVWGVLLVQFLFAIIIIIPILGWIAGIVLSIMYYNAPAIRYGQVSVASGHHAKS